MIAAMFAMTVVNGILSSMQFLVFLSMAFGGLICLGFAAIFGGHHDGEIGHDIGHADHAGDHAAEHGGPPSFLSPRVFLAFLTGFGVAGAIATVYGAGPGLATGIGFIPGFVMALIAWFVAYYLFKEQVSSSIRPGQVVGAVGTVVTAIQAGGLGEVNVSVNGQIVPYTAISEDGESSFRVGTRVKVIRDLGDKVSVSADI
jgi:membrane protein implicated in regulation of membrane protease activity